ncbi:MAG: fibronectin type III domain-containing protein [Anaerotignum sp.]|nr:fibronectin type III domain-containing protein [Anaerotignum sp.]
MQNTKSTKRRRFLSVALTLVMAMSLSVEFPLEARAVGGTIPAATTGEATSITATSAMLNGSVNAQGDSTAVVFEYGEAVAYGSEASASESPLDSSTMQAVSKSISGLEPNTTYHYRVKATNAAGTVTSDDISFTTLIAPPSAPTIGTATAGNAQASVSFTPPVSNGGGGITGYTVTSSPGGLTGTGAASPIIVTGLANGTAYTFAVTATNSAGPGAASTASNSVTPKASQTITFTNPGAQNFGTNPTLAATATSGLDVSFSSTTTGVCTITSGGALTFVSAGTATINADQAGNSAFHAAPTATQSFTVNAVAPGAPTAVTATAGNTSASVSFTAPASNGGTSITGYTVTSSPGGLTGTGAASPIMVTGLTNGTAYTFTVTATNSVGTGAASTASSSVIPKTAQTITFANPGTQNFGTTPTLSATSSSNLPVSFSSSTTAVCTITSGGALTFISAGSATINADQAGDGTYLPAYQVSRTFTVKPVAPGAPTAVTATAGDTQASVSFTAPTFTGGTAITSYTVTVNPADVAPVNGGGSPILVTELTNGQAYTFTVTATNSAGTGAASTASNSVTPRATQIITFNPPVVQNFGTTPILTATADSGLTPSFTSSTPSVCTITSAGALTFISAGTATINADQAGNGSYLPAPRVTRSFTVNAVAPGAPTIGVATVGNGQATVSFTAPASNGGAAITGYTVTANPGGKTATGLTSPITVTGLTNATAYTFTVTATNGVGTSAASAQSNSVTPRSTSKGGGGSSSSTTTTTQTYKAEVKADTNNSTLPVVVDKNTKIASVDASTQSNLMTEGKNTVITVPSIPNVDSYTIGIPVPNLSETDTLGSLTIAAEKGTITVPSNMLAGVKGEDGNKAQITIGEGNKGSLPDEVKAAIGDRPLIQLTLSVDGKQTEWKNPAAPVMVAIPYTPTAQELKNPEGIVVWYIDGKGNVVTVPNGRYDSATGMVTFATTHFSDYAVAYNPVSFNDVAVDAWYNKAVTFIAARGITTGTGDGNFSPQAKLTRGEFIVLMMKAYGIAPDTNAKDNFADGGNTYYTGYLAKAKQLGITSGIGNDMYAPNKEITRQEMFTLLYNALKAIDQLPQGNSGKVLSDFTDAAQIDNWAVDAMTFFVKTNTVGGNGGKLSPTGTTTRGEMVQVLYNLLGK